LEYQEHRVAMGREKSGKIRFYSRSGKNQGVLFQVREFLNSCSKSVKSQGILSQGCCKLFYWMFSYRQFYFKNYLRQLIFVDSWPEI